MEKWCASLHQWVDTSVWRHSYWQCFITPTLREVIANTVRIFGDNTFSTIRDGIHQQDPRSIAIENPFVELLNIADVIFRPRLDLERGICLNVDWISTEIPSVWPHPLLIFGGLLFCLSPPSRWLLTWPLVACYIFSRWCPSKNLCRCALEMQSLEAQFTPLILLMT